MKPFYITTAIDYANGSPHLGHAYEKVLTDVVARLRRLQGMQVRFLTGLDEHGQKVQQTAAKKGQEPLEFCNQVAEEFKNLCRVLNISNDDFIRTTESRHVSVVQKILQQLFDAGEIYQAPYKGFYSTRQEQFLQEKDKVDGQWPEIFGEVTEIEEPNYFFKLASYQDWLIDHLKANPGFIYPAFRQKQVLEFLKQPLNDLCISRPTSRLSWGIPLPFDPDYVTYVWFDALLNYYSGAGVGEENAWPADYHVIGKDILVPSHAVYWPIMLKAAGIPLPKSLLVHGWWLSSGQKMAKTTGNVVNPLDLVGIHGADAFRYFLIREMNVGQDSDFSEGQFLTRYTSDLANDLGNLVNRFLNMSHRYFKGVIGSRRVAETPENDLESSWSEKASPIREHFDRFEFHWGLEKVMAFVRDINRYAETRAPWKLAKSEEEEDRDRLESCLANMGEGLRLAATALTPVMPETSDKVHSLLGTQTPDLWTDEIWSWGNSLQGNSCGPKSILFPKPGMNAPGDEKKD